MLYTIKHRVSGAVLFSLGCGSFKLCVEAAVKSGADLRGAYLRGADLRDADLRGAHLRDADLGGADLIDGGQDARGHRFYAWRDKEAAVVVYRAGCHEWTSINDALAWYGPSYPSDGDRTECIARLNLLHSETLRRWPAISNGSAEA